MSVAFYFRPWATGRSVQDTYIGHVGHDPQEQHMLSQHGIGRQHIGIGGYRIAGRDPTQEMTPTIRGICMNQSFQGSNPPGELPSNHSRECYIHGSFRKRIDQRVRDRDRWQVNCSGRQRWIRQAIGSIFEAAFRRCFKIRLTPVDGMMGWRASPK